MPKTALVVAVLMPSYVTLYRHTELNTTGNRDAGILPISPKSRHSLAQESMDLKEEFEDVHWLI